ncbi:segregation/condensation protein A [Candidatus Kaiserbacteria bacterium]|nr:segregation/condensation protein A [Candidatus Kaiserbacteria bacterium]
MSEKFAVTTDTYQGPLEALLDLIESRKLSISEISLAEVTDAFLAYVEKLHELPLGETAQFILVASTLLLIKSRALLPDMSLSDEERESVEELERRLARLKLIRQASRLLRKEWGKAPYLFARRTPARSPVFSPAETALSTLRDAMHKLIAILPKPESMIEAAVAPILALEDVILNLKQRLTSAFRAKFSELTKSRDKHERIVYFLAMLELVRSGSASATQERLFEDITIEVENVGRPQYGV